MSATYLKGSEMDNAVNVGVGLEDLIESRLVGDIQLGKLGFLAANQLNALQRLGGGVGQVVRDNDLVASLEEREGGERANVARSTNGECGVSVGAIEGCIDNSYPVTRTEPADMIASIN